MDDGSIKSDMHGSSGNSFGGYLRSVRIEKKIAIEEIAAGTRIGWETLLHIEDENHERLPAEVFVRGFIRSYAKAVGADVNLALQGYEKSLSVFQRAAHQQSELMRSGHLSWLQLCMSIVFLAAIASSSIYLLSAGNGAPIAPVELPLRRTPAEPFNAEGEFVSPSPVKTAASNIAPAELSPGQSIQDVRQHEEAPPQSKAPLEMLQRLSINAIEETWIKVTTDGMRTAEYMLKPEGHLEIVAEKGFSLLIGNAAGIVIRLNGQSVPIHGKSGQVITLQVP